MPTEKHADNKTEFGGSLHRRPATG